MWSITSCLLKIPLTCFHMTSYIEWVHVQTRLFSLVCVSFRRGKSSFNCNGFSSVHSCIYVKANWCFWLAFQLVGFVKRVIVCMPQHYKKKKHLVSGVTVGGAEMFGWFIGKNTEKYVFVNKIQKIQRLHVLAHNFFELNIMHKNAGISKLNYHPPNYKHSPMFCHPVLILSAPVVNAHVKDYRVYFLLWPAMFTLQDILIRSDLNIRNHFES